MRYCTHPRVRESDPAVPGPLPEAETCNHDECRLPDGTVFTDLEAAPAYGPLAYGPGPHELNS